MRFAVKIKLSYYSDINAHSKFVKLKKEET